MRKSQLLSIIARIRRGATSPQNIFDSLNALATNPPYGGTAITTTLPTVLAQGEQVIYRDPNGVQSLWIGNADGEAWPAVGYKEYVALLSQSGTDAPVVDVIVNNTGHDVLWSRADAGMYLGTFPSSLGNRKGLSPFVECISPPQIDNYWANIGISGESIGVTSYDGSGSSSDGLLNGTLIHFRIYP
jgi:hypothetical protein